MGSSSSKEFTEPLIGYKFPTDRVKMRQVRNYPTDADAAVFDPTADKYDYLIVFENSRPKKPKETDGDPDALAAGPEVDTVSWSEVELIWFQAIPGEEEKKNKGVRLLLSKIEAMLDVSPDSVKFEAVPKTAEPGASPVLVGRTTQEVTTHTATPVQRATTRVP